MPYVITDSLFERLEGCVKQQRLLGVMGMLEELRREARRVDWDGYISQRWNGVYYREEEVGDAREANSDEDVDGGDGCAFG